jgi:metal-responsive CopG/Arc/MetJ family transcriptional regulator
MRTIIDLPEESLQSLAQISVEQQASRTELIRQAVALYIMHYYQTHSDKAFGLWKNRPEDALAYQEALRKEWD